MEKQNFRVIIAGCRYFVDYGFLRDKCNVLLSEKTKLFNIVVVSGGAFGVDQLGEIYAEECGYSVQRYPADWAKNGKAAGPIRNAKMADNADALIAFWDGQSRGTKNMIEVAKNRGLKVRIIRIPC